jgi:hypothetical protein
MDMQKEIRERIQRSLFHMTRELKSTDDLQGAGELTLNIAWDADNIYVVDNDAPKAERFIPTTSGEFTANSPETDPYNKPAYNLSPSVKDEFDTDEHDYDAGEPVLPKK